MSSSRPFGESSDELTYRHGNNQQQQQQRQQTTTKEKNNNNMNLPDNARHDVDQLLVPLLSRWPKNESLSSSSPLQSLQSPPRLPDRTILHVVESDQQQEQQQQQQQQQQLLLLGQDEEETRPSSSCCCCGCRWLFVCCCRCSRCRCSRCSRCRCSRRSRCRCSRCCGCSVISWRNSLAMARTTPFLWSILIPLLALVTHLLFLLTILLLIALDQYPNQRQGQ